MAVVLKPLPYPKSALAPSISEETLEFHYGKHHKGYVDKLNGAIEGKDLGKASLKEIVLNSQGSLFNLSAQAWNHEFYWESLSPKSQTVPQEFQKVIEKYFGSLESLKLEFTKESLNHFGSGWAWLVRDSQGAVKVCSTHDADTPLVSGLKPLLTCDVWEHAYYLDYKNNRAGYLESFWNLVNWSFAYKNYSS